MRPSEVSPLRKMAALASSKAQGARLALRSPSAAFKAPLVRGSVTSPDRWGPPQRSMRFSCPHPPQLFLCTVLPSTRLPGGHSPAAASARAAPLRRPPNAAAGRSAALRASGGRATPHIRLECFPHTFVNAPTPRQLAPIPCRCRSRLRRSKPDQTTSPLASRNPAGAAPRPSTACSSSALAVSGTALTMPVVQRAWARYSNLSAEATLPASLPLRPN